MKRPRTYVEVYQRPDNLWDWRLNAANGEIVCSSIQGYTERNDALEGFLRAQDMMAYTPEIRYA